MIGSEVPVAMGVPIGGRRVRLEGLEPRHSRRIYELASSESTASEWPMLGTRVAVDEFYDYIWQLGSIQFAVVRQDNGEPIGLVQGIDEDARSRTIGVGFIVDAALWKAGWPIEGIVLFIDYLFCGLGYRKLYFSMPESALRRVGAVGGWLTSECVYRRHVKLHSDYEDLHILSMMRSSWDPSTIRQFTQTPSLG